MRRAAAVICLWGATASADPVPAGVQPVPPVAIAAPVLPQKLDGRRHVRGCPVDDDCRGPGDVLRQFEAERIPPPGGNPWISERTPPPSTLERTPARYATRPSELRPDAPWLDQLALPDLPVRWTQRLVDYLVFYRDDPRGHSIMKGWLVAQGRYRDMIVAQLRKARLPEDLLYVSMIESSYDPTTRSRAGAVGLWQYMPAAARIYGLRRDRWVDERRDPYRSTLAQMDYFRDLYQRFGDWHTAIAAFNVGYGGMLRAIATYNTNDYYQLCEYENALPWGNCWYTPKVLAAAIVGRNRAAFGFDKLEVEPPEAWDQIAVPTSISLGVIARAAGVSKDEIERLNPHLRRGRTPPGEPGYLVRVPAGRKADAQRRLVELQTEWDGYDAYVVAHGERFEDIATTFGISRYALRKLNGVTTEAEITGGTVLVVPRISEAQRAKNRAKARADLHSSGLDQRDGEPLIVAIPDKDATVPGKRRVFYRVVSGDTVSELADVFAVRTSDLIRWNAIDREGRIHPRQVLAVWVAPSFDARAHDVILLDDAQLRVVTRGSVEHLELAAERSGRKRVEYVVPRKEKVEDVAKRFGMRKYDLAKINRFSYNKTLEKGETIIVYEVVDPTRSKRAAKQWKKLPRKRRRAKQRSQKRRDVANRDEDKTDKTPRNATSRTPDGPVTKPTQVD